MTNIAERMAIAKAERETALTPCRKPLFHRTDRSLRRFFPVVLFVAEFIVVCLLASLGFLLVKCEKTGKISSTNFVA